MVTKHYYGYRPDLNDQRDFQFTPTLEKLPTSVDWRSKMPPVYNQGQLGSCTANAIAGAIDYERGAQGESFITPSRLFIYYNERAMENTVNSDSGASLRDGIKSVKNLGDCPESEWKYTISKFKTKPPVKCYTDAIKYKVVQYQRVTVGINSLKQALSLKPVVFGFTVYESFESDTVAFTGIVPMPKKSESVAGGHAVVACGYNDSSQSVICRNSWGSDWGVGGYFYMPYSYFTGKLTSDYWVITLTL